VLVGPPAVGKSTYCKTRLPHHVRVNQDTLRTRDKCIAMAKCVRLSS
jgi:predicted kinase